MASISFITVSREEEKVQGLRESITSVFGHKGQQAWDLLVADGTAHDLFTGYNSCAKHAVGDVLVFTHDDVRFLCNERCFQKPLELLTKPFTGILGVAGTTVMPKNGKWWDSKEDECRGMVAHPDLATQFGMHFNTWPHMAAKFGRVVICDGVFLMCSRRVFDKLGGFDQEHYKGFHFYDVDFTIRAHIAGLQNWVAPIPLMHGSKGRPNENWEENRQHFMTRYEKNLPARVG
jgi:GT2 family glycosyltransferase